MLPLIDYTICYKNYGEFHVGAIYTGGDDYGNPISLWTAYHYYNPKEDGTVGKFIEEVENKGYLNCYKNVEEIVRSYLDDYIVNFVSSEKEINEKVSSLGNGCLLIAPYDTFEFIVTALNNWMDDDLKDRFSMLFECEVNEIVDKYGFDYSEDRNKLYYLDGDSCVEVPYTPKELFNEIMKAYNSNDDYKYEFICKLLEI